MKHPSWRWNGLPSGSSTRECGPPATQGVPSPGRRAASPELSGTFPDCTEKEMTVSANDADYTSKDRNLDRAVSLAANGRIRPEDIVATAKEFDDHLRADQQ